MQGGKGEGGGPQAAPVRGRGSGGCRVSARSRSPEQLQRSCFDRRDPRDCIELCAATGDLEPASAKALCLLFWWPAKHEKRADVWRVEIFSECSGGLVEVPEAFVSSVLGSVYRGVGPLKWQKSLFEPCIGEKGEMKTKCVRKAILP